MAGVRNGPLARGALTTTGSHEFGPVPPLNTWLLKTFHAYNLGSSSGQISLNLQSADGGVFVQVVTAALAANEGKTLEFWTTAAPGDLVVVNTTLAPVHVWLSGAELPGVMGEP